MAKHTNKFVDQLNKGDKFYLAVFTRGNSDAWIGEVELQSKSMTSQKSLWDEPKMTPTYVTEYYYTLNLKTADERFSITFHDFGWNGDSDLKSNNIKISGASLLVSGFWVADCYMTTDREAFKKFINENRLLEQSIVALQKDKEVIEKKLKKLLAFHSGTIS
jgi:hypothetical protein